MPATFGIPSDINTQFDPAAGIFTSANFPGASSGELSDARELYALLTGRVGTISAPIALDPDSNQYVALGPISRAGGVSVISGFPQDTWRLTPTVTLLEHSCETIAGQP